MIGFVPDRSQIWVSGISIGLLVFFLFLGAVFALHSNTTVYPQDDLSLRRTVHSDQCERPKDQGRLVEVQNTLSNAAYALAGMFVLLCVTSWAGHMLGINLILLSIFSGLYHATLTHLMQVFDVAWVYAALMSLSVYISYVQMQIERPYGFPRIYWIAGGGLLAAGFIILPVLFHSEALLTLISLICLTLFVATVAALLWVVRNWITELGYVVIPALFVGVPILGYLMRDKFGWDSDAVFPILILLLIVQLLMLGAAARSINWNVAGLELGVLMLAILPGFLFRLLDGYHDNGTRKALCSPDLAFQAHAYWHLLSAVALLLAYDFVARFQPVGEKFQDIPVFFPKSSAYEA